MRYGGINISNWIVRAFSISFGNSFDFATNFNLYRFFSSHVKSLTKRLKRYVAQLGFQKYRYRAVLCPLKNCLAPNKRVDTNTYLKRCFIHFFYLIRIWRHHIGVNKQVKLLKIFLQLVTKECIRYWTYYTISNGKNTRRRTTQQRKHYSFFRRQMNLVETFLSMTNNLENL